MKLLHICTGWPLSYQGGITNYVRQLAQTQFENGIDVSVLGAKDDKIYDFNYVVFSSKIIPFNYDELEDKDSLQWLNNFLFKEQFDIIHIHALEYVDWDLYTVIKKYHYIVSLHDYCFICPRVYMFSNNGTVCKKYDEKKCSNCISYLDRIKILRKGIEKINEHYGLQFKLPHIKQNITRIRYSKFSELLNHADYILPVSRRVEEIYKESGIFAPSKVLHIGNISADTFKSEYIYNEKPHVIKIVFLGRLTVYKGANLFLKIASKMKNCNNVQFHFLGNAGEYESRLKRIGIINHGKYNQAELGNLLQQFDMGMVLSIWEDNGPQVVMELLNNHIPVIGTKMGGISDFVTFDNGYIFDPYSENEIEKLCSFLSNVSPIDISKLKKQIKHTTTSKEHYDELMRIYDKVLFYNNKL